MLTPSLLLPLGLGLCCSLHHESYPSLSFKCYHLGPSLNATLSTGSSQIFLTWQQPHPLCCYHMVFSYLSTILLPVSPVDALATLLDGQSVSSCAMMWYRALH